MIIECITASIALLEQNRVCWWEKDISPTLITQAGITTIKACAYADTCLALTEDGLILFAMSPSKFELSPTDVTACICNILGISSTSEIIEIDVAFWKVIVVTEYVISIIEIRYDEVLEPIAVCKYHTMIDLFAISGNQIVYRTDRRLYVIGGYAKEPERIVYDEDTVVNIKEIVCDLLHIFLVMNDGSVLECPHYYYKSGSYKAARLIEFPEAVVITKLTVGAHFALCLDSNGSCWDIYPDAPGHDHSLLTRRILREYTVTRLFITTNYIVVLCEDGQQLLTTLDKLRSILTVSGSYTTITSWPLLDIEITAAVESSFDLYLTTTDSQVYVCANQDNKPCLRLMPFFVDHPIAIRDRSMAIRSASSVLRGTCFQV